MSEVKRFIDVNNSMEEYSEGPWVKFEAYDALQQKLDAANAELARYSMPAGQADQFAAEAKAVRKALGFAEIAEDVAPVDLLEKIAGLRAEGAFKVADYHFVRIDALKDVSRQGYLFHKAAYFDAVNIVNLLRAETDTTPSQYESLAGGK